MYKYIYIYYVEREREREREADREKERGTKRDVDSCGPVPCLNKVMLLQPRRHSWIWPSAAFSGRGSLLVRN